MPNKQNQLNAQKPDGKIADLGSLSEQMVRGGDVPLGQLLVGIAALPRLLKLAEEQTLQIECLLREVRELRSKVCDVDGWMDARGARAYLGNMAEGTFDKYYYKAYPRIKGYKLDGKLLFKRSELDLWVRLYETKSREQP